MAKRKINKPPRSMRKAINAKCKDCIFDSCVPGTWRQQVEDCTITDCPLWNVRPKTTATTKKDASDVQPDAMDLQPSGV